MTRYLSLPLILLITVAAFPATLGAQAITLQDAIQIFLDRNLEVEAARYRVERTRADQIAARLRPNPGLTLTAENFKFSGPAPFGRLYEVATSYAETIELGGKRRLRVSVADLSVSLAESQFADVLRQKVAELKRIYYEAVLARYNVEAAAENRSVFEQLVQFNLARFQEGAIPESDLLKVRLERVKLDSAHKQSELALRQAVIRVVERLGQSDYMNREVAGELGSPPANLNLDELKRAAIENRPDVRAAELEIALADQRLDLERARNASDITPFAGYKRVAADNTVLFGISIPLRIRDRNQAGIARATADQKIARAQLGAVKNRVLAEVESAYRAYETAREQVNTFRDELLRQADESRTIALAAYEEGATELLPVIEAQRTRTEIRQQYFRTLFDYHASVLQLESAVGKEIQP